MAVILDPDDFPHIFEAIFMYLTTLPEHKQTIYNARLVSTGMHSVVDSLRFPHISLTISPPALTTREVVVSAAGLNQGPRMALPFFSHISTLLSERQSRTVRQIKTVTIQDRALGFRETKNLVTRLSPSSPIILEHGSKVTKRRWDLCLPEVKALEVVFSGCHCNKPQRLSIKHSFTTATVRLQFDQLNEWASNYHGYCPFWVAVLQPDVKKLEIVAERPMGSWLLSSVLRTAGERERFKRFHELRVTFTPYFEEDEQARWTIQADIAQTLGIEAYRVTVTPSISSLREDEQP